MKPLLSETKDNHSLQTLGRASIQIVHDLKNQLNGLKLYATFLRKRLEKTERPGDELETVNKLIAGLDRTAADLSLIVQFGEPVKLAKQPGTDLQKILAGVARKLNESPRVTGALSGPVVIDGDAVPLVGEFDSEILSDALSSISLAAMKLLGNKSREQPLRIRVRGEAVNAKRDSIIEWPGFETLKHDPFNSFAGSDEIRMALAAKVVEAHGGSAEREEGTLCVRLPLAP